MKAFGILVFLFALFVESCIGGSDCTAKYAALKDHTMCKYEDSPNVVSTGVSQQDIDTILKYHNDRRAIVDPPGKDLFKLVWDDKLAVVAEKWGKQCKVGHDKNRNVPEYPNIHVGQNLAAGQGTWEGAMAGWYNEYKDYTYGVDPPNFGAIGHYTQFVSNLAIRIGCGYVKCSSGYKHYYVCNYAKGQYTAKYPYASGKQCSACPDNCKDGLCDCGGLLCLNGGTLDKNKCTCTCPKWYGGEDCSQLECPADDNPSCGTSYPPEYCKYSNIKPLCPYMCGPCSRDEITGDDGEPKETAAPTTTTTTTTTPAPPCSGKVCQNGGSLDESSCDCLCKDDYTGDLCQSLVAKPDESDYHVCSYYTGPMKTDEQCKTYGNKGHDTGYCKSKGGSNFDCHECKKYSNVWYQYCPVMCGRCPVPCNNLKCTNGGTLGTDCKCKCKKYTSGAICDQISGCPSSEPSYCDSWPDSYCVHAQVQELCPFKCGPCT